MMMTTHDAKQSISLIMNDELQKSSTFTHPPIIFEMHFHFTYCMTLETQAEIYTISPLTNEFIFQDCSTLIKNLICFSF